MTEPNQDDNSWADLARELELEIGAPAAPPASAAVETDEFSDAPDSAGEAEYETVEEMENEEFAGEYSDSEESTSAIEVELSASESEEGEPGGKKKRRRRRRRRRKGGPESETEASQEQDSDEDDGEADADSEEWTEPAAEVEESPIETPNDVIANWNVPSWEQIVAGLYRPPDHHR